MIISKGQQGQMFYMVKPEVSGLNFRKIEIKLMIAYMATADMELRDATPGIINSYDKMIYFIL